jgi:hypothetical protein
MVPQPRRPQPETITNVKVSKLTTPLLPLLMVKFESNGMMEFLKYPVVPLYLL